MKDRLSWKKLETIPPWELKVLWLREALNKESPESFLFSAYEILTDEVPRRSVGEDYLPPSYFCSYLPFELDQLILQGLKDPKSFSPAKVDRVLLDELEKQGDLRDLILQYERTSDEKIFSEFLSLKQEGLLKNIERILSRMEKGKTFIKQDLHCLLVEYRDVFSVDETLQKIYERMAFYQIDRSSELRKERKKLWLALGVIILLFVVSVI